MKSGRRLLPCLPCLNEQHLFFAESVAPLHRSRACGLRVDPIGLEPYQRRLNRDFFPLELAEQRANNVHIRDGVSEDDYVAMREARDAKLPAPLLLMPSIQVNWRAAASGP